MRAIRLIPRLFPTLMVLLLTAFVAVFPGSDARAQVPYPRAAWFADIPTLFHDVEADVTIIDERTLLVEHFTYDGTAPLVYFYLGAGQSHSDFQNGLQLEPLLDRAYSDETLVLTLPGGEDLDGYEAISVWCAQFAVDFGSAMFTAPATTYPRASWVAQIPPGAHDAEGRATIINDRILHIEEFTYDGTAPLVYFYLGATDDYSDFLIGQQLEPLLDRAYASESLVLTTPDGTTLDGYGAISVWCAQFAVNFSSAPFVNPLSAVGENPAGHTGFTLRGNAPNPFNPTTRILFDLAEPGPVNLAVYAVDGRRIKTLITDTMQAGPHAATWHGEDEQGYAVASGTYFYRLKVGRAVESGRMSLVR